MKGAAPKKYACVYPYVRTTKWYLLPADERSALLSEHGEFGREFPDVQANTTSAFGLGDWEWILAFEADDLSRIVDCLRRLREAKARDFTKEEVPFVTGIRKQLVDAIHVVARGDALLSPSITRRVIEEFVAHPPDSVRKPPPELEELTARELEMLRYLARGLSNAEIAKEAFVSETTVKTHVARILMKLRIRDRVQAVVLAYETGVVHPGESPP